MAGEQTGSTTTPVDPHDAAADAALDAIGFQEDGSEPSGESESSSPPDDSESESTQDTPDGGTDPESSGDDPEDEPGDEPSKSGDLDKARRALARAKVPKKVIDALDDDELLAWGTETAQNQATVDKAFTELKELQTRKSETDSKPTDESQTTDGKGSDTAAGDTTAPKVDLSDEASAFREEFGDEATDAMLKLVQASQKPMLTELAQVKQVLGRLSKASEASIVNEARQALVEHYPEMTDEQFAKVRAKAETLAKTGDYKGKPGTDLFGDAAKLELGLPKPVQDQEALRNEHRSRSRGTPSTSGRKPTKARSVDQRRDAAIDAALDGKSSTEVAAAYQSGA